MNPIPIPAEISEAYPDAEKRIFGPPEGVPDEECGTVEILIAPYAMGGATRVHHAYFRPTADELEALNAGALIEVSQIGNVLQPFAANVLVIDDVGDQAETDAILSDPEAVAAIEEAEAECPGDGCGGCPGCSGPVDGPDEVASR